MTSMSGIEYLHQTRPGRVTCPVWAHRFRPDVYETLGGGKKNPARNTYGRQEANREWAISKIAPGTATDLNDLGAIPGNDIAIKPYRENQLPFPEGTIIAWLAWSCIPNLRHRRRAAARRGLAKEGYHDCSTNLTLGELIRKKWQI